MTVRLPRLMLKAMPAWAARRPNVRVGRAAVNRLTATEGTTVSCGSSER